MDQDCLEDAEVSFALLTFVTDLAEILADRKDEISVESVRTFNGFEITLRVAYEDIASIAGYKSKTMDALRLIANAVGVKANLQIVVSLQAAD